MVYGMYLFTSMKTRSIILSQEIKTRHQQLQALQDALNENIMAVPASNTELEHVSLTMKKAYFTTANIGTYTDLISLGDMSSKYISTGDFTTRSATEASAGSVGTITYN